MDSQKHDQFAALFLRDQSRVFRYIYTLIPCREDAEDIFQQTGLTLWQRWEDYDHDHEFVPWACGIAHNHVRNFLRTAHAKRKADRVYLSEDVLTQIAETTHNNSDLLDQRHSALKLCMGELEPDQQDLIGRCYAGSQKLKAIAEAMGITDNALYKTLRRLRRALFDCISQKIDTDPRGGNSELDRRGDT